MSNGGVEENDKVVEGENYSLVDKPQMLCAVEREKREEKRGVRAYSKKISTFLSLSIIVCAAMFRAWRSVSPFPRAVNS